MTKEERKEVIADIFRMLDKLEELHTQELSEQFPSIPEEEIREVVHWRVKKMFATLLNHINPCAVLRNRKHEN